MSEKNGSGAEVDALRAEIRRTRADLGETVQALAAKADVKARAREHVEQTRQQVRTQIVETTGRIRQAARTAGGRMRQAAARPRSADQPAGLAAVPVVAILAGVVAVVGVILVARGRRR